MKTPEQMIIDAIVEMVEGFLYFCKLGLMILLLPVMMIFMVGWIGVEKKLRSQGKI